jgi:hypothetical protein
MLELCGMLRTAAGSYSTFPPVLTLEMNEAREVGAGGRRKV